MLMNRSNRYRPRVTWNELFFNQTGAFNKPFLFSIVR